MESKSLAGTRSGVLTAYGVGEANSGTEFVWCTFSVALDNGATAERTYTGWLTDGALPYVVPALLEMGLENSDLAQLLDPNSKALKVGETFELKIQTKTGDDGVARDEIRFVNKPGKNRFKGIAPEKATGKLRDLSAKVKTIMSTLGHKEVKTGAPAPTWTEDEIPF